MKTISLAGVLSMLLPALPALAQVDASDIALVEDTDGSITGSAAMPNVYLSKAACAFYKKGNPDAFDAVFVFSAPPLDMITNTQQGWPVKQDQKGIGRMLTNQCTSFCSYKGRLRQAVKMGTLSTMPNNPDAIYTGIFFFPLTGIQLMAHEFGHHWMASVTFDKKDGTGKHCIIRGFEPMGSEQPPPGDCDGYEEGAYNQHWSYYFNSRSLMYGSMIEDLGGGKFKFYYKDPKFSELDQYLMGLRAPEEVGPLFLVDIGDPAGSGSASLPMQPNSEKIVEGKRLDFTVQDVINAEGPREPKFDNCHWKAAMILIHAAGKKPNATEIAKMVTYANRWEEFYSWSTDGRGSMDLTLDGSGKGNEKCPAPPGPIVPDDAGPEPVPETPPEPEPPPDVPPQPEEAQAPDESDRPDAPQIEDGEGEIAPDILEDQSIPPPDVPAAEPGWELAPWDPFKEGMACKPGEFSCSADLVLKCLPSGADWEFVEDCAKQGNICSMGGCRTAAKQGGSSGGCGQAGGGGRSALGLMMLAVAAVLLSGRKTGRKLS